MNLAKKVRPVRWVSSAATLLMLTACAAPDERPTRPLIDERLPPDILVEGRKLDPSPTSRSQRLLRGWRFEGDDFESHRARFVDRARLEVVNLEPRDRTFKLALTTDPKPTPTRIKIAEHQLESDAIGEIIVLLPRDVPPGRTSVDIEREGEAVVDLRRSGMARPLPAGEARIKDGRVLQSGWTAMDFTRPRGRAVALLGRFVPPEDATAKQKFEVHLTGDASGHRVGFAWRSSLLERWRGARDFQIPISPEDRFLRVRLLALGQGPEASWLDLRFAEKAPEEEPTGEKAETALPPAPPVIVLYVLDALRADVLGHLGGRPDASPTLDQLAAEGVTFTRHHSVAPNTTPSTKSLFTGQYYPWLGQKKLPQDGPTTLAELFRGAGYRTGAFTGNGNISVPAGNARGFEILARRRPDQPRVGPYNDDAEKVHAAAEDWLDTLEPDDKVFLYLHTVHPHGPYDPPEPYLHRFTADQAGSSIDGSKDTLKRLDREGIDDASQADRHRLRELYLAGLAYNDAHLADFLEKLRRRFVGREILTVVTSDHGEELFEHGGVLHGSTLYQEQLHVPLILHWPGRLEPGRVESLSDAIDLHRTLRHLLGQSGAESVGEDRSLWDFASRETKERPEKDVVLAFKPGHGEFAFSARSHRYKLIWAPRDTHGPGMGSPGARSHDLEYVFDLENDPGEQTNLAGEPSLEVEWLRSRLHGWLELAGRLETGEEITGLDEETLAILKALGYLD